MQLGMPTLVEAPGLADSFALAGKLGLQFIELNMNLPEYQTDVIDADLAERLSRETGIFLTLHLDENLNPCDFNPLVREAYVRTMRQTIALAKRLSCPVVNMHLHEGVHFKLPGEKRYLFGQYEARYLGDLQRFRDACAEAVGDGALLLCIENTSGYRDYHRRGIELFLQAPCFGLTLDVGHDYSANAGDLEFILSHENRLKHMHLHGATRQTCHLPPDEGELDLLALLALGEACGCRGVVEVKTASALGRAVLWINGQEGTA